MVRGYQPVFPQDHCTASLKWLGSFEPSHLGIAGVNYRTT